MKQKKSKQVKSHQSHSTTSSANYKIICTDIFLSEAKRLAKKYPNIKKDFLELKDVLKKDPITGNDYIEKDVYKVRMPITDKGKGQSGGARVIIQVKVVNKKVYVLSVYDKGDKEDLVDKQLKKLLNQLKE